MAKPPLPGSVLRLEVLAGRQRTQSHLARAMGISSVRVHQIVHGKARITADVAVRLGEATATDPAYWLGLQSRYDLYRARLKWEAMAVEPPQPSPHNRAPSAAAVRKKGRT